MTKNEEQEFMRYITSVMAFYKQDVSPFVMDVWFAACEPYTLEQVRKALTAHATDAQHGQFAPKPADLVRALAGTTTDKAMVAWGKLLEAMSSVGAYQYVCFDDAVIHAVVSDMGGWVKVCRTPMRELGFMQTQFCKSYQAYAGRGDFVFAPVLCGERSSDASYERFGIKPPAPVLVGDVNKCQQVMRLGASQPGRVHRVDALLPDFLTLAVEDAA